MSRPTIFDPATVETLPSLEIAAPYTARHSGGGSQSSQYCQVRVQAEEEDNTEPLFCYSKNIILHNGPFQRDANGTCTYIFNKEDNADLLGFVKKVEQQLKESLHQVKPKLPSYTRKKMAAGFVMKECDGEKLFVPSSNNCASYDWNGDPYKGQLKAGTYQAVISMRSLFLGQTTHTFAIYPQWRVEQIRYAPKDFKFQNLGFLFDTASSSSTAAATTTTKCDATVQTEEVQTEDTVEASAPPEPVLYDHEFYHSPLLEPYPNGQFLLQEEWDQYDRDRRELLDSLKQQEAEKAAEKAANRKKRQPDNEMASSTRKKRKE